MLGTTYKQKDDINAELHWNVLYGNFNSGKIEVRNVFDHHGFLDGCRKAAKKHGKDRDAFEEYVRHELMYYYWSKCEWEVVVSHWPPSEQHSERFTDIKIDVYDQVMMNWEHFIDYLWEHKYLLAGGAK